MNIPNGPAQGGATPARVKEICQFEWHDQALEPLNVLERSWRLARRKWRGAKRRLGLISTNPPLPKSTGSGGVRHDGASAGGPASSRSRRSRSGGRLEKGDLVVVLAIEEIRETLDQMGKHDGLKFLRPMERYCGETHRVMKRVKYILDDRTHVVRKTRGVVLLDGVICDGQGIYGREDCDRSCFFFWKEAWLRRVDDSTDDR